MYSAAGIVLVRKNRNNDSVILLNSWGFPDFPRKRWCPKCTKAWKEVESERPWTQYIISNSPVWLIKKSGKYGDFWGCPNFPKCDYSESTPKEKILDWDDELRPY